MARESGEERKELCMRLRVEFSQQGAAGAWWAVRSGYFADILPVPPEGGGTRFEEGELESLAAGAAENCEHPAFADDVEMHLLPLRLLYLRDLIRVGQVEAAAYQAFQAGTCFHRADAFPYQYHARRKVQAGGFKRRGVFKKDPELIRQGVGEVAGTRKFWKSKDELYKLVARKLVLGKSTIKRHAGDLVAQTVAQTPANSAEPRAGRRKGAGLELGLSSVESVT